MLGRLEEIGILDDSGTMKITKHHILVLFQCNFSEQTLQQKYIFTKFCNGSVLYGSNKRPIYFYNLDCHKISLLQK